MAAEAAPRGLLVDWGGVLTTNVFASFETLLPPRGPRRRRSSATCSADDPEARHALFALETGELTEPEFEAASPRSSACARTARRASSTACSAA